MASWGSARLVWATADMALRLKAGMPVESLRGSQTGVFAASMSDDYSRMQAKDIEGVTNASLTGTALALLPNRMSWYFDLQGPSIHIDTACSGSLVALDMACQSLRMGDATMALVAGANLILGPEGSLMLSNGNYLSPDSVCHSFDHRANGYARGEGIVAIVIKPLRDAVRDGDMIRAVIRATASNQDGRTPILTQPSADAQERLIRKAYQKAGLDFGLTRFFEAHGTGTAVGDPAEMKAIGRVFRRYRSDEEPLYVQVSPTSLFSLTPFCQDSLVADLWQRIAQVEHWASGRERGPGERCQGRSDARKGPHPAQCGV